MPRSLPPRQHALLRVFKGTLEQHTEWGAGAYLREVLDVDLVRARDKAVADRVELASRFLLTSRAAYRRGHYRDAVSRGYYAAYHALRAATFKATGGDDFERHSDLPNHLPDGLPNPALTKNGLTAARLARNNADYDPYPKSEKAWKSDAEATIAFAGSALRDARDYVNDA